MQTELSDLRDYIRYTLIPSRVRSGDLKSASLALSFPDLSSPLVSGPTGLWSGDSSPAH
jgi:hypothetical protein